MSENPPKATYEQEYLRRDVDEYFAAQERLERLELRAATTPDGGLGSAVSGMLPGLALAVGGVWFLLSAIKSGAPVQAWICPVIAIALGGSYFPYYWPRAVKYLGFGNSRAEITPGMLRPGRAFTFRYTQQMWLPLRAQVTTSLVMRERATMGTGDEQRTEDRDHLLQSFETKVTSFAAGSWLEVEQEFRVPADAGRSYRTGDWPDTWLIKIRILPRSGLDLWRELELPLFDGRTLVDADPHLETPEDRDYELVLMKNRWIAIGKFTDTVQTIAPHLTTTQIGALATSAPVVLARGLTRLVAERARVRLETVGGVVEVRQGGVMIPAPPGQHFPIPHGEVNLETDSLPRPVGEQSDE